MGFGLACLMPAHLFSYVMVLLKIKSTSILCSFVHQLHMLTGMYAHINASGDIGFFFSFLPSDGKCCICHVAFHLLNAWLKQ